MIFRTLNAEGIAEFRDYLGYLRLDASIPPPAELLSEPRFSSDLPKSIEASPLRFRDREEFARWLHESSGGNPHVLPRSDPGFWAWLSLALFDQVCPPDGSGCRRVGANARYIPDPDWRRRYRHLLSNPFDIFLLHRDDPGIARFLLLQPLHRPGEIVEQLSGRIELIGSHGLMGLVNQLFVDPSTGRLKRGALAKSGGMRRFGKLVSQYIRTWDLQLIDKQEFAGRLPRREFGRFLDEAVVTRPG